LEILEREKTRIAGLEVERYTYRIRDENLRGLADAIMRESHKDRLEGRNDGFMTKRDVLGKSLAINFLYSIGIREVYVEPTRHDPYKDILRKILANRRPDVIGFTENEMYVTEIKYRFEERDGRRSLKNAIKQVSEYYDLLTQVVGKEILDRRVEKLSRIVVIIGYDHRSNGGYIPSTIESLRERYPEAFRHLDMSREAAQRVSREMSVRLETIVDRNGYTYTRLRLRIARWSPGEILARTREATEAFHRWSMEMGRDRDSADPHYRREESRTVDELYEVVKTALKSLLNIPIQPDPHSDPHQNHGEEPSGQIPRDRDGQP